MHKTFTEQGDVPVGDWQDYVRNNRRPRIKTQQNEKTPVPSATIVTAFIIGVSVGLVGGLWLGLASSYAFKIRSVTPSSYEEPVTDLASLPRCKCGGASGTYTCVC